MGTDFNGAFSHGIPYPPTESIAQSMRERIRPTGPMFQSDWSLGPSSYDSSQIVCISGHGLSVHFGPHAALISSGYKWPAPAKPRDEVLCVISAMREVARFFRSPHLIFMPDDIEPYFSAQWWIKEGITLEELQQRLAAIQKPSPDFGSAIRQNPESYEVAGYVIEELKHEAT